MGVLFKVTNLICLTLFRLSNMIKCVSKDRSFQIFMQLFLFFFPRKIYKSLKAKGSWRFQKICQQKFSWTVKEPKKGLRNENIDPNAFWNISSDAVWRVISRLELYIAWANFYSTYTFLNTKNFGLYIQLGKSLPIPDIAHSKELVKETLEKEARIFLSHSHLNQKIQIYREWNKNANTKGSGPARPQTVIGDGKSANHRPEPKKATMSANQRRVFRWWVIKGANPMKPFPAPQIFKTHSSSPLVIILISFPIS